ncbi:hypothetical protein MMC26_004456 [Xylographa opegraphella]|nr:hypothetical protein [Xylographa opegraphella]
MPSHVLPVLFAVLIGLSLSFHVYQNFRYSYWHITFFMFYGGVIFMTGWVFRAVSANHQQNLGFYIAQIVLILCGPPVYAAAEYNILGRLMHYLPMHAPLNPSRVFFFFIYLGALVETMTGVGAGQLAGGDLKSPRHRIGGTLIAVALVLQAAVEVTFMAFVTLIYYRAHKARMLSKNVRTICIMLYCTSSLILLRCIFRAVEAFESYGASCDSYNCGTIANNEWYLYAFESAPMVVYTFYLNVIHPGRFLPIEHRRYLDLDGTTERMGPGWIDERSKWKTFLDPFDVKNAIRGRSEHVQFWKRPGEWPVCEDGSFALGTATNIGKSSKLGRQRNARRGEAELAA